MAKQNHEKHSAQVYTEVTQQEQGERPADVAAIEGKLAQYALEAAALTDELQEVGVLLSELGARQTSLRRQLTDNREASDELVSQLPNPFKKRLEALEKLQGTSRVFEGRREVLRNRLQAAEQELQLITAPDGLGSISILPALEYHLEKHARYAAGAASRRVLGERENPPKGSRLHYIELRGHFFNGKERVSQYPALFSTEDLYNNPEVVISTLEKIIAAAYPPIIRQYVSVEAIDNTSDETCRDTYGDPTGYSYFLCIHAEPVVQAPAPDEVR